MSDKNIQKKKNNKNTNGRTGSRNKASLLTYVLLICIVELTFGAIQNINKNINFSSKIKGLENKRNEELVRNKQLKAEIKDFNSDIILESIARNNLKMAGEDEVLIIINKPEQNEGEIVNVNEKKKNKKINKNTKTAN